jgi:hypothetical protein
MDPDEVFDLVAYGGELVGRWAEDALVEVLI